MSEKQAALTTETQATPSPKQQVGLENIFTKSASFQSYSMPGDIKGEWKPEIRMEFKVSHNALGEDKFEVILVVNIKASTNENPSFDIEVKQAGIFILKEFEEKVQDFMLGAYCPNMLYPYAREAISDAVVRGGFPQLLLVPLNFDAIYQEQEKQKAKQSKEKKDGGSKAASREPGYQTIQDSLGKAVPTTIQ